MALVCGFPMYDSCEWTNPSDFEEIAHLLLIFPGSVLGSFPMRISLLKKYGFWLLNSRYGS